MAHTTLQRVLIPLLAIITLTSTNLWRPLPPGQASESWWSRIFRSRPPDPPKPGGSRPGSADFCAISPFETLPDQEVPLASTNPPTLVWQGNVRAIELLRRGQTQPLWSWHAAENIAVEQLQPVQLGAATVYQITANVELQPDQQYEWRVYQPFSRDANAIVVRFAVVSAQQQAEIQRNLPSTTNDAEPQIIHSADFLASQHLWSDFWHELLSIEHPSEELNQALSEVASCSEQEP